MVEHFRWSVVSSEGVCSEEMPMRVTSAVDLGASMWWYFGGIRKGMEISGWVVGNQSRRVWGKERGKGND